jgi:hypothetical protein
MNINLLFLLIIIFILLTFIIIFFILFNYKKIEKFTETERIPPVNFPPLINSSEITILYKVSPEIEMNLETFTESSYNAIINRNANIREKYDITDPTNIANNSSNGFGTYYIQSSFYAGGNVNENNNNISRLLNNTNNNTHVTLLSPNLFRQINTMNWISIKYPDRFQFSKIQISALAKFNTNTLEGTNISIENISPNKIYIGSINISTGISFRINPIIETILNGDIVTFIYSINNPIVIDNLYFIFDASLRVAVLFKIEIFGYPINSEIDVDISTSTDAQQEDESVGIFTSDINSHFPVVSARLRVDNSQEQDSGYITDSIPIYENYRALLANNTLPWAVYSASKVSGNILGDVYNRACRNATIKGTYSIKSDNIPSTNKNISYLEGDINTTITFPEGSLPTRYTICIISKYTNPNNNRGRILTSDSLNNPDWLLGHYNNRAVGVMFNDANVYINNSFDNTNTNWRVSCVKSRAKNVSYGVIFDDVPVATAQVGINNNTNARLAINGIGYKNELSDFGFAYLVIWDYALSDNELLVVSKTLTNYIRTGDEIPLISNSASYTSTNSLNYGTRENPGLSAIDIKNRTCTNIDGIYWIRDPTRNNVAKPIYCIMDERFQGGGWMLAMKGDKNNTIFAYYGKDENGNNYWTSDNVFNENDIDTSFATSAKYNIFNYHPVRRCMAIFDIGRDENNILNKYGWSWIDSIPGNLSLKEFFKQNKSFFAYYSSGNYDLIDTSANYNRWFDNTKNDAIITKMASRRAFDSTYIDGVYSKQYWSRQEEFKSYGFNICAHTHNTRVRWGGVFNENPGGVPDSCDVSGGIGLSRENWGAGNPASCCASHPIPQIQRMAFKWFIK